MTKNRESGVRNQQIGSLGEEIASEFLKKKGHKLIDRNYRKSWGELDVVTSFQNKVHIVEVKSMEVDNFSRERSYEPEELVDKRKLKKVARAASLYMESKRDSREYQIDVVAVLINHQTKTARCKHIEQVLEDNL